MPSPMTDPLMCGRKDVPRSALCDPDHLLPKDQQDEIEGHINSIEKGQVAVAIVSRMDLTEYGGDVDKSASRFARSLHDRWGVGDKVKNDGVLVFLSIADRAVYISTGAGSSKLLGGAAVEGIIQRMKSLLRVKQYGKALVNCVIEVSLALEGKLPSSSSQDYGDPGSYFMPIVFFTVIVFSVLLPLWQKRKLSRMERGQVLLESLMTGVDNTATGNRFYTSSCPICLEDFPVSAPPPPEVVNAGDTYPDTVISTSSDVEEDFGGAEAGEGEEQRNLLANLGPNPKTPTFNALHVPLDNLTAVVAQPESGLKAMALRCGHTFCADCLKTFLKSAEGRKCPICRMPVHADFEGPGGPGERPTQPQPHPHPRDGRPAGAGAGAGLSSSGFEDDGTSCVRNRNTSSRSTSEGSTGNTGNMGNMGNAGTGLLQDVSTADASRANQDPAHSDYDRYEGGGGFAHHDREEIRFRMNRMRYLYPDVMTARLLRSFSGSVDRGAMHELRAGLSQRSVEIAREVTQIREAQAAAAKSSGSRGSSRSSFGGGRSSGGGGGRW
ncbi:TLP18.3, Psb32 and MOLO-1 founding proteins of phosphatase-domain-containing protein [Ochromonadaceae sp. CCMP2298]|nr:TLP18.3, Psb32 and MOLO-1 founding proteins of phosphatase-domain-containing protein [Ochromonadaceae sp. CCMP2298]